MAQKELTARLEQKEQSLGLVQTRAAELEACNRETQALTDETDRKREALERALNELGSELQNQKESVPAECQTMIDSPVQAHKIAAKTLETAPVELDRTEAPDKDRLLGARVEEPWRREAAMDSVSERPGLPAKITEEAAPEAQNRESAAAVPRLAVNRGVDLQATRDDRKTSANESDDIEISARRKDRFDKLKDLVERVQIEEGPTFPARRSWRSRYFGTWIRRRKS